MIPRMRRGEVITEDKINRIIDDLNAARVQVAPGVFEARHTSHGVFLSAPALTADTVCVAKVTAEVAKATSATRPGKGTLQRYLSCDLTTTPATLADLTGVDEDCVSTYQDKKVAAAATVVAVKSLGVWVVVHVDSCLDLLA